MPMKSHTPAHATRKMHQAVLPQAHPDGAERIVSSLHLVAEGGEASSELEFGLIIAWHAFSRWCERCMAAAGGPELAITDILLLHHVSHRGREKKLADICFVLNFEDTHVVSYALRKLVKAGLASARKVGKEVFYATTPEGEALVQRYRGVRDLCLVPSMDAAFNGELGQVARALRRMSGFYDQAARAATSL